MLHGRGEAWRAGRPELGSWTCPSVLFFFFNIYVFGCVESLVQHMEYLLHHVGRCLDSLVRASGLRCPVACVILVPNQGWNPHPRHRKADS